MAAMAPQPRTRTLLLIFLGVLLVLPFWVVRYPPLVDYPNHLARAYILAHPEDPVLARFYEPAWGPYPYLATDLIMVALQGLFDVETAGRILLSLLAIAVPLAAWWFVREANPDNQALALFGLLAAHNTHFLSGFLNSQLAMALCFAAVALWLRWLRRPSWGVWIGLLLTVQALYFSHVFGFGVAGILFGVYALVSRLRPRQISLSWVVFVPGVVLYAVWRQGASGGFQPYFTGFAQKVIELGHAVDIYSLPLKIVTAAVLIAAVAVETWHNPRLRLHGRWLALALILFGIYFFFPEFPHNITGPRLAVYLLVLVLAVPEVGSARRLRALGILAVALFALRTGDIVWNFVTVQPELQQMADGFQTTPPGARVLALVHRREPGRYLPRFYYAHFWAYGAVERGWFCPRLFHKTGNDPEPLGFRVEAYDPGIWMEPEAALDWERVRADYDYVWAYDLEEMRIPFQPAFASGRLKMYKTSR